MAPTSFPQPSQSQSTRPFNPDNLVIVDKLTHVKYWTAAQVSEYYGINKKTLSSYVSRKQAPPPEGRFNGLALWNIDAVLQWHGARPSQRRSHKRGTQQGTATPSS